MQYDNYGRSGGPRPNSSRPNSYRQSAPRPNASRSGGNMRPSGDSYSRMARKRRKRRKRIIQAVLPVVIAVVLIAVVIIVAKKTGLFDSFSYSSEKADLNSYFQCMSADTATVIRDGEMTEERLKVRDNRLYLGIDEVLENFNDEFYYETSTGRLLYTTGEGVYETLPDTDYYSFNGTGTQLGYTTCYLEGEELQVALDYVRIFTNFEARLCGGGSEPYRAEIKTSWGSHEEAQVTSDDIAVRISPEKKADILKEMKKGDNVVVDGAEDDDWMKVTTDDLFTGYIEKKYLSDPVSVSETPVTDAIPINVTMVSDYAKPVVLAWHNVTNTDSSAYLKDYTKYLDYINVISPTWFSIADDEGTVASIASQDYVTICHDRGIKVWGLVDNVTYPDISSYNVLSDPDKRTKITQQLLSYAQEYNLDGINIDFEQLSEDAGPCFVQFIREFCIAAHKQNLVVSVDNYVPQGYTLHYNRKEQGVFADYVVIMGYDEHTSGSEEAGSVASLDFVLDGIEKTLAEVPANKVINGLPLYTRYWSVGADGMIVDMQTLPIATAEETVAKSGAAATWDEETSQNYAEWPGESGITNKIWLEDADSLKAKLEVMKNKNIGGAAVWQLAYSTDSAWEAINEYYKP